MAIYSIKRGCQFGRISRLPLFLLSKTAELIALFRMRMKVWRILAARANAGAAFGLRLVELR
jgi:hypothetical protein